MAQISLMLCLKTMVLNCGKEYFLFLGFWDRGLINSVA